MACDINLIQEVPNAKHTLTYIHESDGIILPGKVEVNYTCNNGYAMKTDEHIIGCFYQSSNRSGSTNSDDKLMVAKWNDTAGIICEKGM